MNDDAPSAPAPGPPGEPALPTEPAATLGARRPNSADVGGRRPGYKGAELDAARGPGLGCFWFQVVVLGLFVVLIPVGVNLNWPFELLAVLLFIVIGLLLLVGQTLVFLLRLVAAERGQGRRRPLASRTRTVGELQDAGAAAENAGADTDLDDGDRVIVDAALERAVTALRRQASISAFALVLAAGQETPAPLGPGDAASLGELLAALGPALVGDPAGRVATCRDTRLARASGGSTGGADVEPGGGPSGRTSGAPADALVVNVEGAGRPPRAVVVEYRREGAIVDLLRARPFPGERLVLGEGRQAGPRSGPPPRP